MKRATVILTAIVLLAVVIRITGAVYWDHRCGGAFHFGDSLSYHTLAHAVATGAPYEYTDHRFAIFRTPGYPVLMAPIFWFFGESASTLIFRMESVLFSGIGLLLTAWGAIRFTGNRTVAPGIALIVLAFSPGAIAISFLVLTEVAFIPWMLATLILLEESLRRNRMSSGVKMAFLCGICSGIATLIRPSWMLCVPGILGFLLLFRCGIPRKRS
ncbi:MAG: glycosyltransferase family 39 protein, partial [Planctomycetia bacterium]|nr:glycosyltransferase family 39 protein [Planctomycetia bacterium]